MSITSLIQAALQEDVGSGDHTALACIPAGAQSKARLLVKEPAILAGVDVARQVFAQVDPSLRVKISINDGSAIQPGDIVFTVEGPARSILTAERLVLNCMQRMSGIATKTKQAVDLVKGLSCKILDTRKTTPGFRLFEKMAVKIGGGENHRFGLYDMMMIKDNHVDFAGGIKNAIERCVAYQATHKLQLKIEVETRNLAEVEEVLRTGQVHRIMLDNFKPAVLKEAVQLIGKRFETEASGGITLENLRAYGETGVDYISMGALTHSATNIDLSLKAF